MWHLQGRIACIVMLWDWFLVRSKRVALLKWLFCNAYLKCFFSCAHKNFEDQERATLYIQLLTNFSDMKKSAKATGIRFNGLKKWNEENKHAISKHFILAVARRFENAFSAWSWAKVLKNWHEFLVNPALSDVHCPVQWTWWAALHQLAIKVIRSLWWCTGLSIAF